MAGVGTRLLKLELASDDVTAEVSKVAITSAESDSDFVTFSEAAAGGKRDYKLALTAVQDHESGSIWDQIFTAAGSTVAGVYIPYGNTTPSATQPHFTFNAVIAEPEGDFLGGEANKSSSARMIIEVEWELTAKPVKVTSS